MAHAITHRVHREDMTGQPEPVTIDHECTLDCAVDALLAINDSVQRLNGYISSLLTALDRVEAALRH